MPRVDNWLCLAIMSGATLQRGLPISSSGDAMCAFVYLCASVCTCVFAVCTCVFAVCTCVFFSLWRVLCRSVCAVACIVSAHPLSSSSLIAEERVHASLVAWCKSANRKSKCQVLESKCQVIKSKCQVPRSCPTRFLRSGEVIYISISREQRNVA